MSGRGKVVCVTGASGFIGSWLVKILLQRGYTVRATVRDPADPNKTEHLLTLDGAKERLQLFKANLLEKASFDSAIVGCDAVFHTASPVIMNPKDPQTELIEPAVKGTLNVLNSVARASSVKRVVLTSSMAALMNNPKLHISGAVVDETWFSDAEFCKEMKLWYSLSKTLAEEAAWKFAKDEGIDMVTINPGIVIGSSLEPTLNFGAAQILKLINGCYKNSFVRWVHVKDVVEAHIQAFENPLANGRYCLAESVASYSEVVDMLRELYPTLPLSNKCANDEPSVPRMEVSKEKAKDLGLDYIPMKDGLKGTVESLREYKFINF